jgi:predicted outer membrane lipoprotein
MSQEFNLLGTSSRSTQSALSATHVAWTAGVVLAIGVATALWLNFRADQAEKRIALANTAIEDLVMNLQERSQFLAQRNANPDLVNRLQQLERESTDKGRVLDVLSGKTLGNMTGFSAHLAALGRQHPDGLWLQQIRIGDGGRQVMIRGRATSAALVPQFIGALQAEPAFSGVSFERFEMKDPKDSAGPLSFALESGCDNASTPEIEACPEPVPEAQPEPPPQPQSPVEATP